MKKLIVLFLAIGIALHLGDTSLYAQRVNGQGPAVKQGRGPAQTPRLSRAQTRSQGRANAGIENPNRDNARGPEAGRPETGARAENAKADVKRPDMNVANSIERNPRLSSRFQELLPAGMSLTDAAAGFKNKGQFIAAIHVSKNLNIPFEQMKAKMTGENSESLGRTIHELRPDMTENQAKAEAKKAEGQAKATENPKSTR